MQTESGDNLEPTETLDAASQTSDDEHGESLADVEQLGMWAAIRSLGYVFWIVGAMEMIERLAYYGVRAVTPLYFKRPISEGALGVGTAALGGLFASWALVQSIVPVFTGGLSDRYGYKQTIAASTALKIVGYLVMGVFHSYEGFFAGAMLLALGTAVFKPGIQGTLVKATSRKNSSMAWGIFYQTVNIGGWIGPLIALQVRNQFSWSTIFYVNALFICLNFLLLITYQEPGKEERIARQKDASAGGQQKSLWRESLAELKKPHLTVYLLVFTVWWFMFPMLWDVLPAFVDDWVDTRVIVAALFGEGGTQNIFYKGLLGMNEAGTQIMAEGIVNINAAMIMITCFLFAALSAKMRATTSMVVGTVLVVVTLNLFGMTNLAWIVVLGMVIFSVGEMLASPKFSEYLGNIAPPDKKAMWLGFSQAPIALGWTIEGFVGPKLYAAYGDKDTLARQWLASKHGWAADKLTTEALPIGEAFNKLVEIAGSDKWSMTQQLYAANNVSVVWYVFAAVGVVSAVLIYAYGRWTLNLVKSGQSRS